MNFLKSFEKNLKNVQENFEKLKHDESFKKNLNFTVKLLTNSIKNEGKIIFAGNGGSAADSQHLAAELVGRYLKNRRSIPALALTTDTSIITSLAKIGMILLKNIFLVRFSFVTKIFCFEICSEGT